MMNIAITEPKTNAVELICNDMRHQVSSNFDCMFIVGDPSNAETVFGCKYLFAIESPVFEKMLLGDFQEAQNPKKGIPLPDDDPQAVRHFRLLACCTERASRMGALCMDETLNLAQFCNKYMALSIAKLCNDRLMSLVETAPIGDLIKMFGCGVQGILDNSLKERVNFKLRQQNYPLHATVNVLTQDDFKKYLLCHLQDTNHTTAWVFTTIEGYLKFNDLIPTNLLEKEDEHKEDEHKEDKPKTDVDNAEYLVLQTDKRKRTFLRDLLRIINFGKMDIASFISGPGNSKILTIEQKYYILTSLCRNTPIKLFED